MVLTHAPWRAVPNGAAIEPWPISITIRSIITGRLAQAEARQVGHPESAGRKPGTLDGTRLPIWALAHSWRSSYRYQSGYSSLRQARGSSGPGFGVRSSRKELYGATNGSGAATV